MRKEAERGILICGSGVEASIAANRISGIRAGPCRNVYSARQGVEHDGMNVLVLGARAIGFAVAEEAVKSFLHACFSAQGWYLRQLQKAAALEKRFLRSLQREWQ